VPLIMQLLAALCAGALLIVVARQLGLDSRRAFGAASLVAISVATVLALPTLREDVSKLLSQRKEYVGLSPTERRSLSGAQFGLNTDFIAWVDEHLGEGETFYFKYGQVPGQPPFEIGGTLEGAIVGWGSYRLGPHLAAEDAASADWIIFYGGGGPADYVGKLGKVLTYEPGLVMARNADAS
jgi:hypothetical protein